MRNAPTRAIQELAGHQNLSTTQRYMHLSGSRSHPLLDEPAPIFAKQRETVGSGIYRNFEREQLEVLRWCGGLS
jgi:hypothetical protein